MQIELLDKNGRGLAIGFRKPGRIMDVPLGVADIWIRRGQARAVKPPEEAGEHLVPAHAAERMKRRK